MQEKGAQSNRSHINEDLADVANKVEMTERNSIHNAFDFANQNSSGIHGSSAIGYDSEDYYHAVNL
jgi:hypothetical protein